MPTYLYHAASKDNADEIMKSGGLEPRSGGGEDATPYLCMSATEDGATTKKWRANDIIFRVEFKSLNAKSWIERGAGKKEWRGTEAIGKDSLEYRRNLGTDDQQTWRKANLYPKGVT